MAKNPVVTITMRGGDVIKLELYPEVAPISVNNFLSLVQKKFYDAVSPEAVLASAASYNHYGFPSRKVREEMAERNIPLYSTTMLGGMTVTWSGPEAVMRLPEK